MLGVRKQPSQRDGKILPLEAWGLRFMSMGLLVDQGEAVVWRGPMLHGAIKSFLHDVHWGELDYLLVDLPPGTGDVQLSLIQQTLVTGAVVVTTPSMVAVEDAVKAVSMFRKLNVPVLGVIENMSAFVCPHCGKPNDIFGAGTVEERARRWAEMGPGPAGEPGLPFLGAIPIHPDVRAGGDQGRPVVIEHPDSDTSRALRGIAGRLAQQVSIATIGAGGRS
jgi:ATP-binding protein involved in chromosome partitioning